MDYKRLGDHIREVNVRNRDLRVTEPMGINIDKYFMPSVANVIGTDLSVYKMVCKNQFACNLMHVGRDEKIPMAMHTDDNPIIVSPAYFVFEIVDSSVETHGRASLRTPILPEYLMMWFRRPEFDRNAWFYTDADVRGGLDKDAFMDMRLPIPSVDRQREIVAEYETLSNRIRLNEQMIEKLEASAQALYRKMFVDGVDMDHLPEGWRKGKLGDICDTQYGYSETATTEIIGPKFLRITDIVNDSINWSKVPYCPISESDFKKYKLELGDIVVSRTGANIGWAKQIKGTIPNSVFASFLIRIKVKYPALQWLVGHLVESLEFKAFVEANQQGSAQPQANANVLVKFPVLIPNEQSLKEYNTQILPINRNVCLIEQENSKLTELQSLLLARMGK
jgi:type I restriction enzyme S subunit